MKHIYELFKNGNLSKPSTERSSDGFEPGDKLPAEEYNWVENDLAKNINASIKSSNISLARHPKQFEGITDDRYPSIQQTPRANNATMHAPYGDNHITLVDRILDCTIGYSPESESMIMVASNKYSISASGASSATLLFVDCEDFSSPLSYSTKQVTFPGFTCWKMSWELPVCICDGFLYVLVTDLTGMNNKRLYRYSLSSWSGVPIDYLDVIIGPSAGTPCLCTELIEATDSTLAVGYWHTSINQYRVRLINKDMTDSDSLGPVAATLMHRKIRSDGVNIYSTVIYASYDVLVYSNISSSATTSKSLSTAGLDTDWRIADVMPLGDSVVGGTLIYLVDTDATPGDPHLRLVDDAMNISSYVIDLTLSKTGLDASKFGCFGFDGVNLYTVWQRTVASSGDYGVYSKTDMSKFLVTQGANTYLKRDDSYDHKAGPADIDSNYTDDIISNRMMYDGMSMWFIHFYTGDVYRIPAPLVRR